MASLQSTQRVFGYFGHYVRPATLVVQANGGSVVIEVLADGDAGDTGAVWIAEQTVTADGVLKLEVNNSTVRITPVGGAMYSLTGV